MRILPLWCFALAAILYASEPSPPSTDDTLKIRALQAQLAEMQTYWKYRAVVAEFDKAHQVTEAALAELSKKLNCPVDPQSLACPKPEPAK